MHYVLGLDIGITSVGWAVLELNIQDEPIRIVDLNSRIFERAEIPKTGESLAAPRRVARSSRRRTRRRRFRLYRIRRYLLRNQIITPSDMKILYDNCGDMKDIYTLRHEALDRAVTSKEWARLLIFFGKHRGFKSNRKSIIASGDEGVMLQAVKENQELLKAYRTVGDMLYSDTKFANAKRNKGESYTFTVSRRMLTDEIQTLFCIQRDLGQSFATPSLEDEYLSIFLAQRNFDEGPGGNSPYSGNQIEKMIGNCAFEKNEKRAPKASYAFMAFNLLQKINHLRIERKGKQRFLTQEERNNIAGLAWKKENLTFKDIRTAISLSGDELFQDVHYASEVSLEECEKKTKFNLVRSYHAMRKALDAVEKNRIQKLSHEQLDTIAYAFTVYKNDDKISSYLLAHSIEQQDVEALLAQLRTFNKFGHLSIKACYRILPYLKEGKTYAAACTSAGYDFRNSSLEEIKDIPNPVVKRAVSQTLKVIRAIIKKYGCEPVEIHIELARELARSFQNRVKMQKSMEENQSRNEKIKERLVQEYNILSPTGMDIVKFKLYEQQQGACAYSQKMFNIYQLFHDPSYAEVDHIIPYSRSFDDSYRNKVLVFTAENRNKGNRTPMEYLKNQSERKEQFITWVKNTIRDYKKRNNLLRETYTSEDEADWKRRHLQDTQYLSTYLYNYLCHVMKLTPGCTERKRRIIAVNGAVTAYVRKRLGINKIRSNGDLHHAVDAVIIACVTQGVINRISRYSKIKELQNFQTNDGQVVDSVTGEILTLKHVHKKDPFPEPWPHFRQELEARVGKQPQEAIAALHLPTYKNVESIYTPFVSRMPNRKVHGPAHLETIRSSKLLYKGITIVKTSLTNLKLKDGEIQGYYNPDSDRILYQALKRRLIQFDGEGRAAFKEPFYKPRSDGSPGPMVKKVKIMTNSSLNVLLNHGRGVADNGAMVRIDVFYVSEKGKKAYYFVPIYVADTVKKELPHKAVVAYKPCEEWKNVDDDDFIFSLYPNDLVYVRNKKSILLKASKRSTLSPQIKIKEGLFYYKGANISVGSISIINNDDTYGQHSLGIKTLECMKKANVDILGNVTFVGRENRQPFQLSKK